MKRRGAVRVLLALLALPLLGELWARASDRAWYGAAWLGAPAHADLTLAEATGLRGRPGARFERWHMNSLGVQGDEAIRVPRPPGVLRVLVLGASEMFGLYESRGMSTSEQLERLLARRVPERVEVLNGALAGLTLPRTAEYCRRELARIDPSVVVYYPNPVTYLADDAPSESFTPPAPAADTFRSRFAARFALLVNRAVPQPLQALRGELGSARYVAAVVAAHPAGWAFRETPPDRLGAFEHGLELLSAALPEGGPRLVLASHAHRYHDPLTPEDARHILGWRAFYPRAEPAALVGMERAANARVRALAARRGAGFADVAARVPPGARYFRDFTHFTDEGAALAAAAFADAIAPGGLSASVR